MFEQLAENVLINMGIVARRRRASFLRAFFVLRKMGNVRAKPKFLFDHLEFAILVAQ